VDGMGSALAAAVTADEEDTVRLLLESGADANAQLSGGQFGSVLAAATARDNQDIVQILLETKPGPHLTVVLKKNRLSPSSTNDSLVLDDPGQIGSHLMIHLPAKPHSSFSALSRIVAN
jgi:ankyrin repeat protein